MTMTKAWIACGVAGLGALGTALGDGNVSAVEWVAVALAAVTALGAVWRVPNPAAVPNPATEQKGE